MALLGRVSPRLCTSYNQHAASLRAAQLVSPVRCAGRRVACASASGAVTPVKAAPLEACDSSAQPTSSDGNSSASSEASELGQVSGQAAERADRTAEATSSGSSSSSDSEQAPWGASADGLTRAERRKAARVFPTLVPPGGLDDLGVLQNAVLLVDKPLTWTSFDVCGKIRNTLKFLGIRKVGCLARGLVVERRGRACTQWLCGALQPAANRARVIAATAHLRAAGSQTDALHLLPARATGSVTSFRWGKAALGA